MEKIKVLIAVKALEVNGVSNVIFSYYRRLREMGVQMDFVSGSLVNERYREEIAAAGNTLNIIPNRDRNPVRYILKMSALVRRGGYSIVHVHGNSAMMAVELLAAKLGGAKVRIAHTHSTSCNHPAIERLIRPLFGALYTHAMACSLKAGHLLYGDSPFFMLPNAIDMEKYRFSPERREHVRASLGIGGERLIGHVGDFSYTKNVDFLIRMFFTYRSSFSDGRLLLVGTGEEEGRIRELVRAMHLENCVTFYGYSDDVPGLMMAMDVLLLPSLYEGLPCVLVEAQALGLACISSDRVTEEVSLTGLIRRLPLDDASPWVEAIVAAGTDNRVEKSDQAHEDLRRNHYDLDHTSKVLLEYYWKASIGKFLDGGYYDTKFCTKHR